MKIACIQLSSGENYQNNFKDIVKYVNQAIKNKSDLIITPETSLIFFKIGSLFISNEYLKSVSLLLDIKDEVSGVIIKSDLFFIACFTYLRISLKFLS